MFLDYFTLIQVFFFFSFSKFILWYERIQNYKSEYTVCIHIYLFIFFLSRIYLFYLFRYLFYMKNPRSLQQINYLARQIQPYKSSYIIESFQKATKLPYSCKYCSYVLLLVRLLFITFHTSTI